MESSDKIVGVIGASSLVGSPVLSYLVERGYQVVAFSRRHHQSENKAIQWSLIDKISDWQGRISYWICVAPIWVLPNYLPSLMSCGAKRIVALSSTSIFTKLESSDEYEKNVVSLLQKGELTLERWASDNGVSHCVLRPTLIYGYGKDQNISEIARFILRFGFFPLWGKAMGLRQPIHADDVAKACVDVLQLPKNINRAYNISGAETLPYKVMVQRIFAALKRQPRIIKIPLFFFSLALIPLQILPRYRHWSISMAERMSHDLVFDHGDATRDFNFTPRSFNPKLKDVTT